MAEKKKILIVEDDPNLQKQIKNALDDSGYSVDATSDGEEGHFLGDTEPYDAVILDLGLPKIDGLTVLEKWRKSKRKFPVLKFNIVFKKIFYLPNNNNNV